MLFRFECSICDYLNNLMSCMQPKTLQPKFLIALRKLFNSLNDRNKMDPLREPEVLVNRHHHDLRISPVQNEPIQFGKSLKVCRHALVNSDDDEFISYAPGVTVGKVGWWVSGSKLTPEESYFEMEIIDCGVEGKIHIGVSSWNHPMNTHIGNAPGSVGLAVEHGQMLKDGEIATETKMTRPAHEYDRLGCGVRFDHLEDPQLEPVEDGSSFVIVYFVLNGIEVGSLWATLPAGGFHPAVSMQSAGEEVRVTLGLSRSASAEDDQMLVDNNEDDWGRLHDIHQRGQILEYCGKGKGIADVGLAQARIPLNTTAHYFEIEIVDPGDNCCIAIGLTRKDYPDRRHPGWNKGSIGYHADDGKIFLGSGRGDPFGPRCHKGDRMGCGIFFPPDYISEYDSDCDTGDLSPAQCRSGNTHEVELIDLTVDTSESEDEEWWNHHGKLRCGAKVEIFFTRNGKNVGMRQVRIPKGGFYPSVGMMGINEKVRVDLRPLTG